jgi:CRP-like cAMP-binding protein
MGDTTPSGSGSKRPSIIGVTQNETSLHPWLRRRRSSIGVNPQGDSLVGVGDEQGAIVVEDFLKQAAERSRVHLPVERRPPTAMMPPPGAASRRATHGAAQEGSLREGDLSPRQRQRRRRSSVVMKRTLEEEKLERERAAVYAFTAQFEGAAPRTRERRAELITSRPYVPDWLKTRVGNLMEQNIAEIALKTYDGMRSFEKERFRNWVRTTACLHMLLPRGEWCCSQDALLDEILAGSSVTTARAGEVVYFQGERNIARPAPFYAVVEGWVDIVIDNHVVQKLHEGALIGHKDSGFFNEFLMASEAAERGEKALPNSKKMREEALAARIKATMASVATVAEPPRGRQGKRRRRRRRDSVSATITIPASGVRSKSRSTTVQAMTDCTLIRFQPGRVRDISNKFAMMFDLEMFKLLRADSQHRFEAFSANGLMKVINKMVEETVEEGAKVFREGDEASFLYFIIDGEVALSHTLKLSNGTVGSARSQVVSDPCSPVGTETSMSYFEDLEKCMRYTGTATALRRTRLLRVGADVVAGSRAMFPLRALAAMRMAYLEMRKEQKAVMDRAKALMAGVKNVDRAASLLHGPSYQRRLGEIARKKEKEANCKRELVQRAQRQAQHIAAQKAEKFLQEQRAKLVGEGHEDGDDLAGSRRLSVRNMSRDERARQLQLREVVKKLHDAAKAHDIATVRAMVKLRPECANGTDKSGATALIHACWDGPLEMCELIVASGCDVNAQTLKGFTALHFAYERGRKPLVSLLQRRGAWMMRNINEQLPHHLAPPGFLNVRDTHSRAHESAILTFKKHEICVYIGADRRMPTRDLAVVHDVTQFAESYDYAYTLILVRTKETVSARWQQMLKKLPSVSDATRQPSDTRIAHLYTQLCRARRISPDDISPRLLMYACLAVGIYIDMSEAHALTTNLRNRKGDARILTQAALLVGLKLAVGERVREMKARIISTPRNQFLGQHPSRRVRRHSCLTKIIGTVERYSKAGPGVAGRPWRTYVGPSEATLIGRRLKSTIFKREMNVKLGRLRHVKKALSRSSAIERRRSRRASVGTVMSLAETLEKAQLDGAGYAAVDDALASPSGGEALRASRKQGNDIGARRPTFALLSELPQISEAHVLEIAGHAADDAYESESSDGEEASEGSSGAGRQHRRRQHFSSAREQLVRINSSPSINDALAREFALKEAAAEKRDVLLPLIRATSVQVQHGEESAETKRERHSHRGSPSPPGSPSRTRTGASPTGRARRVSLSVPGLNPDVNESAVEVSLAVPGIVADADTRPSPSRSPRSRRIIVRGEIELKGGSPRELPDVLLLNDKRERRSLRSGSRSPSPERAAASPTGVGRKQLKVRLPSSEDNIPPALSSAPGAVATTRHERVMPSVEAADADLKMLAADAAANKRGRSSRANGR